MHSKTTRNFLLPVFTSSGCLYTTMCAHRGQERNRRNLECNSTTERVGGRWTDMDTEGILFMTTVNVIVTSINKNRLTLACRDRTEVSTGAFSIKFGEFIKFWIVIVRPDILDPGYTTGRDQSTRDAGHSSAAATGAGDWHLSRAQAALYSMLRRAYTTGSY